MTILETPRQLLRHLEPHDLDALATLYADPETRRYFPDGTRTRAETEEELTWFLHGYPKFPELGLWLDHARRYPLWEVTDLYKLLHQAAMGAEHALTNEAGVREWLTRELAELVPDAGAEEPLLDPIASDGSLVRVHLRPFARLGLDPELLLQAFFRTARELKPNPERLRESAEIAVALTQEKRLPFDSEALAAFLAERQTQGFPAYHHSAAFRQHYQPAYRVVARALLPQELHP